MTIKGRVHGQTYLSTGKEPSDPIG